MQIKYLSTLMALCLSFITGYSHGAPADKVAELCGSCHALERPDYEAQGREERFSRKAPPLYFAGNKYRQEWLAAFLQAPYPLYPSGYFPESKLQDTADGDIPNENDLVTHLQLSESDASEVTDYLMNLQPYTEMLSQDNYSEGKVSLRMGTLDFRKFKGCDACHQDSEDNGGFSGPILYDAWSRLQPHYISAFLKNPLQWDPNTIMPVPQMNEQAVHKLVDYLKAIGEAE
ncbi:MAG: cytochrome C [Pseudomonadales bacterium]|nr:hypothetical protein [Nitrospira sp.]MCP5343310.1 cytochrome C [Pseudomonadales bacterium]